MFDAHNQCMWKAHNKIVQLQISRPMNSFWISFVVEASQLATQLAAYWTSSRGRIVYLRSASLHDPCTTSREAVCGY